MLFIQKAHSRGPLVMWHPKLREVRVSYEVTQHFPECISSVQFRLSRNMLMFSRLRRSDLRRPTGGKAQPQPGAVLGVQRGPLTYETLQEGVDGMWLV